MNQQVRLLDVPVGVIFLLTGIYCLIWIPILKKRLAKREQAGELTTEQIRTQMKLIKWMTALEFLMGTAIIYFHFFSSPN